MLATGLKVWRTVMRGADAATARRAVLASVRENMVM